MVYNIFIFKNAKCKSKNIIKYGYKISVDREKRQIWKCKDYKCSKIENPRHKHLSAEDKLMIDKLLWKVVEGVGQRAIQRLLSDLYMIFMSKLIKNAIELIPLILLSGGLS